MQWVFLTAAMVCMVIAGWCWCREYYCRKLEQAAERHKDNPGAPGQLFFWTGKLDGLREAAKILGSRLFRSP